MLKMRYGRHTTGLADCAGKAGSKGAGRPHPGICGEPAEPFGEAGYFGHGQCRGKNERGSTALRHMEDMRNQTLKEGMKAVALRMLAAGKYALEEIVHISGLSLEEVKQLKNVSVLTKNLEAEIKIHDMR